MPCLIKLQLQQMDMKHVVADLLAGKKFVDRQYETQSTKYNMLIKRSTGQWDVQ